MATTEVVSHDGWKLELRHSKHAFVQRHAGEGIEKRFLMMISHAVGAPMLMCGAMLGSSLQKAAGLLHRTAHKRPLGDCAGYMRGCLPLSKDGHYGKAQPSISLGDDPGAGILDGLIVRHV